MRTVKSNKHLSQAQAELRELILTNFNENEFDGYLGFREVYRNTYTTGGYAFFFNLLKEKYAVLYPDFFITTRIDEAINIFLNLNEDTAMDYEDLMIMPIAFSINNHDFNVGLQFDFENIYLINEAGKWIVYFNQYHDFCILYEKE
jgi:hypothetical protein